MLNANPRRDVTGVLQLDVAIPNHPWDGNICLHGNDQQMEP